MKSIELSGYQPIEFNPNRRIEHFFGCANDVDYVLKAVRHGCISSYDRAFEIIVWSLCFSEYYHEELFGGGTAKAERIVRRASRPYIAHLENVKAKLPAGVSMRIEEGITLGSWKSSKYLTLVIKAKVSVTSEYSKKCYAANSEENVVHSLDVSKSIIAEAREFKERILTSKLGLIAMIAATSEKEHLINTYFLEHYYTRNLFSSSDYDNSTTYNSYGMADLRGIAQCYGMAWAVAELTSTRCFLKIQENPRDVGLYANKGDAFGKAVLLERCYEKVETPTPKYEPW